MVNWNLRIKTRLRRFPRRRVILCFFTTQQRGYEGNCGGCEEEEADGAGEEDVRTAITHNQGADEILLGHAAEDDAENHGTHGKAHFIQEISEDTAHHHDVHVLHGVAVAVGADKGHQKDDGEQHGIRNVRDLDEEADEGVAEDGHDDICQKESDEYGIDIHGLLREEQRPGLQALYHQGTHHDSCCTVARYTESQHGNEGTAADGIIACLGSDHTLGLTVAEIIGMLAPAFGLVIGNEAGNIAAGSRNTADKGADKAAAEQCYYTAFKVGEGGKNTVELYVSLGAGGSPAVLNTLQQLCQGEDTDENRNEADAPYEIGRACGKAHSAAHGIDTYCGKEQADEAAHDTLHNAAAGNACDNGKTEHSESEILGL